MDHNTLSKSTALEILEYLRTKNVSVKEHTGYNYMIRVPDVYTANEIFLHIYNEFDINVGVENLSGVVYTTLRVNDSRFIFDVKY